MIWSLEVYKKRNKTRFQDNNGAEFLISYFVKNNLKKIEKKI